MSWFDEQIRQRKESDKEIVESALESIAFAVTGENKDDFFLNDKSDIEDSLNEILHYYHIRHKNIPDSVERADDKIEYLCRPNGIMYRNITLEPGWSRNSYGAFITRFKGTDDGYVAIIPSRTSGYYYIDKTSQDKVYITKRKEALFDNEAILFYRPLPAKKLKVFDLVKYAISTWSLADIIMPLAMTGLVTLLGLLLPKLNYFLTNEVMHWASQYPIVLINTLLYMFSVYLTSNLLKLAQSLFSYKSDAKLSISVEAATMMRLLSLPANFFRKFSAGELQSRSESVGALCSSIMNSLTSTGITAVFSLVYITQIFAYAPSLVIPSLVITLVTILLTLMTTIRQMRVTQKIMEGDADENGISYAMISGIQKIKLAGAEKRAFSRWAECYAQTARLNYNGPLFLRLSNVLILSVGLIGNLIIYYLVVKNGISVSEYYVFNSVYGMVSGAFMSLAGMASIFAEIRPMLEMVRPILEAEPENATNKDVLTEVTGRIEISNLTFRYSDDMPLVLDNLSLKIKAGQYVAIVGKTGCGKSTLIRLLLGFEKTDKGAIYYDGKNIDKIDLRSLRRKIGTVMQNGSLMQGDIYSNIAISSNNLSMDDAWEAARIAGIAEDIEKMPMGMFTMVMDGAGGFSGGQKQRLMIARAIAPKPKILIFDEATSALDNITQKKISNALDELKCTRIVVAHRLSTIKNCDRIIYLEDGKIKEDGTYDELIALNGSFKELVERQRLD